MPKMDGAATLTEDNFARVPAVYLAWANPVFLAFFSFSRINNLRSFSIAFSPIPTAPTNPIVFSQTAFSVFATER